MLKKLTLLALCLLLLIGVLTRAVWNWWLTPVAGRPDLTITIDQGASLSRVANDLARAGLLDWPRLWTLAARGQGLDSMIKHGEYRFDGEVSPAGLLEALVQGRVVTYSVTLPEGITLGEALIVLRDQPALEAVLESASDPRLLELVQPRKTAEGLFFPDTYLFTRGDSDFDVLVRAHQRMQKVLSKAWEQRDSALPYREPYEVIIMASVVEKETGVPQERQQIAGVFLRRLEKGMRLQTDPTVIYGLGGEFDGNLRRRHLDDTSNPYNTYRHRGLPPTPIALPGAAAISAATQPDYGTSLYFVARGDGSHQFSDTLEEHTAAVRQFQLRRRSDYRSSPGASRR
jgi:UPF0755 protein